MELSSKIRGAVLMIERYADLGQAHGEAARLLLRLADAATADGTVPSDLDPAWPAERAVVGAARLRLALGQIRRVPAPHEHDPRVGAAAAAADGLAAAAPRWQRFAPSPAALVDAPPDEVFCRLRPLVRRHRGRTRLAATVIIRICDIETSGDAPPEHAVCEIGYCDVGYDIGSGQWEVMEGASRLIAPGRPMPPEASAVHHLIDEDLAGAPSWEEVAPLMLRGEGIVALAAHSVKFERAWITDELTGGLPWICTYKSAMRLWPEAPGHSNQCLRYWLRPDGLDRAVASPAHRAFPDAYVTAHLLRDILNKQLATLDELIAWTGQPVLQTICRFGKNYGTPWREIESDYLRWVLERDFDEDVKFTAKEELKRRNQWRPRIDAQGSLL